MPTKAKKKTTELELRSLARGFTEISVQKLGGYVTAEKVEPDIQLRAIGMLLDRGWGRPNQPTESKVEGELKIVIRKMLSDD